MTQLTDEQQQPPLVCACRTFEIPNGYGLYEDGFIHTVDCCPDKRLPEIVSLLDSERVKKSLGLKSLHGADCFYVTHNAACDCIEGTAIERAATLMKDKCVAKARKVLRPYEEEFRRRTNSQTNMVDYVAMVLESLTLHQEQEKQ